jgi:Cellulose biosynthesis protein BcsS
MVATELSVSSIASNWSARVAAAGASRGHVQYAFYVGPEVHHFGQDGYRHTRFGAHFTGLKAENYEWSTAASWAHDPIARPPPMCGSISARGANRACGGSA